MLVEGLIQAQYMLVEGLGSILPGAEFHFHNEEEEEITSFQPHQAD